MTQSPKANEITITRVYDAPLKAVWSAWTDVEQVSKWWGPRGFTITTHSKDLRPGGHWDYTMHGPDGVNYPNKTSYFEVDEPGDHAKLVYDHGANDNQPPLFRVTVLFTRLGDKTKMDMTMAFANETAAQQSKKAIKDHGGNTTWDRLAEYLAQKWNKKELFIINRTFDAPINLVFDVWTSPEHFAHWMGPKGSEMNILRADVRPGGSLFYSQGMPNGDTMYGRANYKEISKPHSLVYTQEFVDKNENVTRHPLAPTWPLLMQTTVLFAEESLRTTRLTLIWEPIGQVTQDELNTFISARTGMNGGWAGSFDVLEEYLVSKSK